MVRMRLCLLPVLIYFVIIKLNVFASEDYKSGDGESWDTSEDEYITDNKGERPLLEKLDLVYTHVSNLIYAFNGTTMFYKDLKTLANMAVEMKNIHDEITELKYSDFDMKVKLNMTESDIYKAKRIYFDTLTKITQLTEILKSFH